MADIILRVYLKKANILSTRGQYLFVALVILITAGSLRIITDEFLLCIFILTFLLFLIKKKKFDIFIFYVLTAWIIINIVSYSFNRTSFSSWTFLGFIVKMLYPYFILKLVGETFYEKYEKIVFIFTCISLPLFAVQILFPGMINIFTSTFRPITSEDLLLDRGWYGIIFGITGKSPYRNSGFMWEPGAFAFMLILALLYRIIKYGLELDLRNIVYVIALLTTFSTMAYIGIALLLISYTISSKKIEIILLTIPLAIIYLNFVTDLDFMFPKMQSYFNTLGLTYIPEGKDYFKVNRIAYILFAFQQSMLWPLGYGIVPSKYMYTEYYGKALEGVGTIASLLLYWGWLGIIFLLTAVYKFFERFQKKKERVLVLFAVIVLVVAFFSNPLEKSPILYSIVFYPFIFNKVLVKKYV